MGIGLSIWFLHILRIKDC